MRTPSPLPCLQHRNSHRRRLGPDTGRGEREPTTHDAFASPPSTVRTAEGGNRMEKRRRGWGRAGQPNTVVSLPSACRTSAVFRRCGPNRASCTGVLCSRSKYWSVGTRRSENRPLFALVSNVAVDAQLRNQPGVKAVSVEHRHPELNREVVCGCADTAVDAGVFSLVVDLFPDFRAQFMAGLFGQFVVP